MDFRYTCLARTEQGPREENQDTFVSNAVWMGVFDGLGGHPNGRQASHQTRNLFGNQSTGDGEAILWAANKELLAAGDGRATTATVFCFIEEGIKVFHVGDTRLYIFGTLKKEQITKDQGYYHILSNCVGGPLANVATRVLTWDELKSFGNRLCLLLTTDGIHDYVGEYNESNIDILEKLTIISPNDFSPSLDMLFEIALEKTNDNCTAVLVNLEFD